MRDCTSIGSAKKLIYPAFSIFGEKIAVSKRISLNTVMRILQSNNFIADLHGCTIRGYFFRRLYGGIITRFEIFSAKVDC